MGGDVVAVILSGAATVPVGAFAVGGGSHPKGVQAQISYLGKQPEEERKPPEVEEEPEEKGSERPAKRGGRRAAGVLHRKPTAPGPACGATAARGAGADSATQRGTDAALIVGGSGAAAALAGGGGLLTTGQRGDRR
ncbi:hypothetical protein [Streptomyces sp. BP-8]|uniref:Uncharacterized protein n=1 Tax=Streptomyces sirii TaxID=3127701 RepID=A0ABZ2QN34_9ACTN